MREGFATDFDDEIPIFFMDLGRWQKKGCLYKSLFIFRLVISWGDCVFFLTGLDLAMCGAKLTWV